MKLAPFTFCGLLLCAMTARADSMMPRTLLEMTGAKAEAPMLSNSILLIIDAQREYLDGALPLNGVTEAVAEIEKLLARARQSGMPIIHVVHKSRGALFNPALPGFEIIAPLRPRANETVVEKGQVSAFANTKLIEMIQHTGRKNLIIVGFMTHNCVSSTARAGLDLGYAPTVVAAATATRDLPDGRGGTISAEALQAASLAALADRTARIVERAEELRD